MGTMEDKVRAGTSTPGRAPAHQGGHQHTRAGFVRGAAVSGHVCCGSLPLPLSSTAYPPHVRALAYCPWPNCPWPNCPWPTGLVLCRTWTRSSVAAAAAEAPAARLRAGSGRGGSPCSGRVGGAGHRRGAAGAAVPPPARSRSQAAPCAAPCRLHSSQRGGAPYHSSVRGHGEADPVVGGLVRTAVARRVQRCPQRPTAGNDAQPLTTALPLHLVTSHSADDFT